LLLVAVDSSDNLMNIGRRPPKTSYLRSDSSRKLYNYSQSSSSSSSSNNYNGAYSGSYGNSANNDDGSTSYNQDDNQDDNYGNDDAASSNSNYQADGTNYNGRDQYWGGYSVQTYTDDEEPEVYESGYQAEDERWEILGKYGGLSGAETVAVAALAALVSVSMVFLGLTFCGYNIFHCCQQHCCLGIFRPTDDAGETIEDGFVKLDS